MVYCIHNKTGGEIRLSENHPIESFGIRLSELRKQAGLSQEAFAELLAVSRQSISKWENDKAYPEMTRLLYMSDYFHVSLDYLMCGEEQRVIEPDAETKSGSAEEQAAPTPYRTERLLQMLQAFLSNLTPKQKGMLTAVYILGTVILCVLLLLIFFLFGKNIGEVFYYLTHSA